MASTSEQSSPAGEYDLDELYRQLREIDVSDQQLTNEIHWIGTYQRIMRDSASLDGTSMEELATGFPQDFLDRHRAILSGTLTSCQKLLSKLRATIQKDINICSRPSLRPLTIMDLPDEILAKIFKYVKGFEPEATYPTLMYNLHVGEIKNLRLTCRRIPALISCFLSFASS